MGVKGKQANGKKSPLFAHKLERARRFLFNTWSRREGIVAFARVRGGELGDEACRSM